MKKYEEPVVDIIKLPTEDIITTSGWGEGTGEDSETEIVEPDF